jgi:uncharacterized membrane protein
MEKKLFRYFVLALILGFIGFTDATYLTAVHFLDGEVACGEQGGCDEVTTSEYATIAGIPVSLFGVVYYLAVVLISVWWFDKRNSLALNMILFLVVPAFFMSAWFVYLMFFVIQAICWWCLVSAASTTILFLATLYMKLKSL